jgi:hypothetical protein
MTGHTTFFKTDRLTAIRTGFSHQSAFVLILNRAVIFQKSSLKDPADGVGYGQHQATVLKYGVLTANAF